MSIASETQRKALWAGGMFIFAGMVGWMGWPSSSELKPPRSRSLSQTTVANPSLGTRWFGPHRENDLISLDNDDDVYTMYSHAEQRSFLQKHGGICQAAFQDNQSSSTSKNLLLARFDDLPSAYALELFKYCALYTGIHTTYWDAALAMPLTDDWAPVDGVNVALAIWPSSSSLPPPSGASVTTSLLLDQPPLHHAFLQVAESHSKVALGMMRFLMEHANLAPHIVQDRLGLFVQNEVHQPDTRTAGTASWSLWSAQCRDDPQRLTSLYDSNSNNNNNNSGPPGGHSSHTMGTACTAVHGEPCCQVWKALGDADDTTTDGAQLDGMPVLTLAHASLVLGTMDDTKHDEAAATADAVLVENPRPYLFEHDTAALTDKVLGMPAADLPYIATIREFKTDAPPATIHETPNYFDILLANNCLPHDKECFKCLKLGYKDGDVGGDCRVCEAKCPCYCQALCRVRPPAKRLSAEWEVTTPRYSADPNRLIPRVIHQTWFEPVTQDKYPNMSRLIESFRQSGWEYEFYDDDQSAQFLSAHFPPQVRQAYDAIVPGAFKADLFRYCVLLVRGGVYADMDILLESNLDEAIDGSVGFMTAQDSPGESIGHRSCLWNGLMAAAPGHPFLAQTIQNVVNNVRNRFTSVDYDDMLCPNPVLSVSHTVDTLFTCGPCILGASLNDILRRHRQTGFAHGDIDLYETERAQGQHAFPLNDPTDPRRLVPGRSLLLRQNKEDMGSHRFTDAASNLIVAATDMPEYDDRPKSIEHYSKSHVKFGIYGLTKLYTDQNRANEEISIRVNP